MSLIATIIDLSDGLLSSNRLLDGTASAFEVRPRARRYLVSSGVCGSGTLVSESRDDVNYPVKPSQPDQDAILRSLAIIDAPKAHPCSSQPHLGQNCPLEDF